ncbi:MAG: HD domain-containing phosphohydrolase [Pseudomonadota bacterium]
MDHSALTQPVIHDEELLHEFIDTLADQAPNIERDVAGLVRAPHDPALIASLFRAVHSIKGDASVCKVEMGGLIAHPIETLLGRVRSGEIGFSAILAEAVLLAMDRLELAAEALGKGQALAHLKLAPLVDGLEALAAAPAAQLHMQAMRLIETVTGFRPAGTATPVKPAVPAASQAPANTAADLHFFHSLALQYEARSPLFNGRTERLLRLALDSNEAAGKPVDPLQLEAAVYMHDIGMLLLPESLWLKPGNLSAAGKQLLRSHPELGAGLLKRMPGWQAAAEMVWQHHEMPDGAGYPRGLKNAEIAPGAKILAIADAFEAVMLKHKQRGDTRSLVRAIAEVNACDNQFAPEWITPFNAVVRKMVES